MSMTVVIYLPDNCGYSFSIPNGNTTTTSQYLQFMIATLKLPDALAKKCFALWLKSPLLDVQLKPQHIPFKMVQQWPMLINRFSMATAQEKAKDEPALIFRRNAFLTIDEERLIADEVVLNILLMEARFNIQQGIYPCDEEDVEQLGALMCLSIKQENDVNEIKTVVKENLQTLVPPHMAKFRKSLLTRQQSMEDRVLRCAKKATDEKESINCVLEFMKICWQLPYYGSVIFPGFVEKAHNYSLASWFQTHSHVAVHVAINTSGIWVIDCEKKHVLLGLLYDEFNWEVTPEPEPGTVEEEDNFPSLFLEFEDEKTKSNKLLRIMSRQAPMMSSMIDTCMLSIREKEEKSPSILTDNNESVKSPTLQPHSCGSTRVRPLFERQNSVTTSRPGKLNLTEVLESGDCLSDEESQVEASSQQPHKHISNKKQFFKKIAPKYKIIADAAEEKELL